MKVLEKPKYNGHRKPPLTDNTLLIANLLAYPHLIGHLAGRDKLTPLHSYWTRYCWDNPEHSVLMAHRGSYKTTTMAVCGAVRDMLVHPNQRLGIIRKTYTDAAAVVRTIKQVMELPQIKYLFKQHMGIEPKATVSREGFLEYNFKKTITQEGSVNAYGLDAGLTGTHLDKIWLDDVVTLKDRVSKAERERTMEILREIYTNIIDPGMPVIWTGTPWHREDAWSIVEDLTGIPLERVLKYAVANTGLLSDEEITKKRKSTTSFLYAANYELELRSDEDLLFQNPVFGDWDYLLPGVWAHVDAGYDGEDTNALTFMAWRRDAQLQAKGYAYAGNVQNWLDNITRLYRRHRANGIFVEKNTDKGWLAKALRGKGLTVYEYNESMNKHIKISTYLYEKWPNIIWDKDTQAEYMGLILDYKEGEAHDDSPDSAASLIRERFGTYSGVGVLNKW